jgi:hypothetical protein
VDPKSNQVPGSEAGTIKDPAANPVVDVPVLVLHPGSAHGKACIATRYPSVLAISTFEAEDHVPLKSVI